MYKRQALAVVSRQPIGIDIEEIFSAQTAGELTDNIITAAEHEQLAGCGLAFSLALTLAFSAKEDVYKRQYQLTSTAASVGPYRLCNGAPVNCCHSRHKSAGKASPLQKTCFNVAQLWRAVCGVSDATNAASIDGTKCVVVTPYSAKNCCRCV